MAESGDVAYISLGSEDKQQEDNKKVLLPAPVQPQRQGYEDVRRSDAASMDIVSRLPMTTPVVATQRPVMTRLATHRQRANGRKGQHPITTTGGVLMLFLLVANFSVLITNLILSQVAQYDLSASHTCGNAAPFLWFFSFLIVIDLTLLTAEQLPYLTTCLLAVSRFFGFVFAHLLFFDTWSSCFENDDASLRSVWVTLLFNSAYGAVLLLFALVHSMVMCISRS
jgi:hypothetical protein